MKWTSIFNFVHLLRLDPYARSLRQNFYFEEQFNLEFDDDGRGKSIFLDSLDLNCVGPSPSSSDDRAEVLLEQLAWKSLHENTNQRKNQFDDALDLLMGFEDDLQGDDYRYDEGINSQPNDFISLA